MSIASLYPSINPSLLLDFANVKRLDPRITFTRTTTATYYDGVTTAKAEENLLLQSQTFDNASWSKGNVTVTANSVVAPDGTTTAETIDDGTNAGFHYVEQTATAFLSSTYTLSCYAKEPASNSRRYFGISFYTGASTYAGAVFDLQTQAVSSGAQGSGFSIVGTPTCTSVGNGWYRCVLTVTIGSGGALPLLCLYNTATITSGNYGVVSYTGSNQQLYLWGAQLEQRSSATTYTATTTQAITNYIPVLQTASAGQARFDHNPTTGESLGLLIEEARTNVCLYSEDFSDAGWAKSSVTISSNQAIAPNGSLTADKLIPSSTGQRSVYRSFTTSGSTSTVSVYLKYGGYQWTWVECYLGRVWFDVLNGVKGAESGATGTITAVGNGWYRCTVTETTPASGYVTVGPSSANSSTTVTVATNDVFSGVFLWGAQAEVGASFATSYIPTTTASVTRNADAASMTGTNFSSWFNNGEGTVYLETAPMVTNAAQEIAISDGTDNNRIMVGFNSSSSYRPYIAANGAAQASLNPGAFSTNVFGRLCFAYKVNDIAASFNAGTVVTDTSAIIPVVNRLNLSQGATTTPFNGYHKKFSYYPIRVTNAQLQALTV